MLVEFNLTNDKRSRISNYGASYLNSSIDTGTMTMAYGLMMKQFSTLKLFVNSSSIHESLIHETMVENTVYWLKEYLLYWIWKVFWNEGPKLNNAVKKNQTLEQVSG